jgi:hypothetical protein
VADWREVGRGDLKGVISLAGIFPGDSATLGCGGGVGSALGGSEPSAKADEDGMGEKGGVGSSGRLAEGRGRGVDPLEVTPTPGVLCADISPVRGVSEWLDLALLGVRADIADR